MNLSEAMDIMQEEFPDAYCSVYVEMVQHQNSSKREIKWKVYTGNNGAHENGMSAQCNNLSAAILDLKLQLGIDQPILEDVEVETCQT